MKSKIKVVMVEPYKDAYITEIGNDLKSQQKIVGGLIEPFYPFQERVAIICNEEGKITGLPLNRNVYDENTGQRIEIMAGTFFICGLGDEDFISLTDAQAEKYKAMFQFPEIILPLGGGVIISESMPEEDMRIIYPELYENEKSKKRDDFER